MYSPQLKTFLRVADAGSFNKAAEESFITPTAVIKQINSLEESLGVKLFDRSHRGLRLTKAGRSMYQDARYIIQYCRDSVTRAKNAMQEDENIIRIGSSPMTPAQLLMALWAKINERCPDIKFQIVPSENTPENAREILGNLGKNIDVVGGIFDETMLELRGCAGLELARGRVCCAVSIHHRLSEKDRLQISDLYGENLLLMHRGWSHYVDQLRDDLWQHHPQIHIVDFDFYSMDVFNRCKNTNDVLLAIPGWANIHPLLKAILVEWEHSIPYFKEVRHCKFNKENTQLFFAMVDHHYQKDGYYNTVFTGNRAPTQRQENFCETDSLLCVLDRSFNDAITFTIKGESSVAADLKWPLCGCSQLLRPSAAKTTSKIHIRTEIGYTIPIWISDFRPAEIVCNKGQHLMSITFHYSNRTVFIALLLSCCVNVTNIRPAAPLQCCITPIFVV